MTTHNINQNMTTTLSISTGSDTWILDEGFSISTTSQWGISVSSGAANTHLEIDGSVDVTTQDQTAVSSAAAGLVLTVGVDGEVSGKTGVGAFGDNTFIGNDGTISGVQFGVFSEGADDRIVNSGKMLSAAGTAVEVQNDAYLKNEGTIHGHIGIHVATTVSDQTAYIDNHGVLAGESGAILAEDNDTGQETIFNTGIIKGLVSLGGGDDHFNNVAGLTKGDVVGGDGNDSFELGHGKVVGDVQGGQGDDIFWLTNGSVKGVVSGGYGNDTYFVDGANVAIQESATGGDNDTLNADSDYVLAKNVCIETLGADREGISLTGNNLDNRIYDANGNEHLSGGGGNDLIISGAGNDVLTGGKGADEFDFAAGMDVDHITDFIWTGTEHDKIDLDADLGVETFDELKSLMTQHGNDVTINFGHGDKLVLDNVQMAHLTAEDFSIYAT